MNSNLRIGVIGAGVVGLSTANFLQDSCHSAKITLMADCFLKETTSDVAAGVSLFRSMLQSEPPELSKNFLRDAYQYYDDFILTKPEEAHLAGIRRIGGYVLSSEDPDLVKLTEAKGIHSLVRDCPEEELKKFSGANFGSYVDTVLTECRRFLPYLTNKFKSGGGTIMKRKVNRFEELAPEFDIVFNCSGLGAKKLCGDKRLTSLRGQIFKVEAPWVNHFTFFDNDTYIIPGFESVTLGCVYQLNGVRKEVDKHDAAGIMERCSKLDPSVKHAKILDQRVGFRPHRGAVRVEAEVLKFQGGTSLKVVHNYGHGGSGVMSAPGTSIHAVQLGMEMLRSRPSEKAKL